MSPNWLPLAPWRSVGRACPHWECEARVKQPSRPKEGSRRLVGFLLLVISVPFACSTQPAGRAPATSSSELSRIPDLNLGPADDIDAIDFAVDRKGSVHVAWRSVVKGPSASGASYKVFYGRGESGGATWTPPIELVGRLAKPPHVVLTPGKVHVVQEDDLRHFVSEDEGRTWQELRALLPGSGRALGLDVLSLGDSIILAYLGKPAGPADKLALRVLRWPATEGRASEADVATFPGSIFQQPAPRLAVAGDRLHLLCGINVENRRTVSSGGRPAEEREVSGRLVYLRSEDLGATWSEPLEIAPGEAAPEGIKTLDGVELLPARGGLYALFNAFGLYVSSSDDGRRWSAPKIVAPYEVGISEGSYESRSVSAAASAGVAAIAWIDARFRRSDRRWWNPLGGVPWSDKSPFWANNDVFLLSLADVDAAPGSRPASPRRLTPPGSFARSLRVRAGPDRFFLLWAGRTRVGKEVLGSGEGPEIFFTTVPFARYRKP